MRLVKLRTLFLTAATVSVLAISSGASAALITVGEGVNSLSDWGITLGDTFIDNTIGTDWSAFVPTNAPPGLVSGTRTLGNGFKYSYALEDNWDYQQNDGDPLGPNAGGQNYDAEFLGVGKDGNRLVIAVATGQRPDNAFAKYSPGDIRITTSAGIFGVEVGGGAGAGVGTAITEGAAGATYRLNSSGSTIGWLSSTGASSGTITGNVNLDPNPDDIIRANALQVAGSIWSGASWILDPINNPAILTAAQMQTMVKIGMVVTQVATYKGAADYYYSRNAETSQHSVIELSIDMDAVFGAGVEIFGVEWSPGCGNDVVVVTDPDLLIDTPEPTSMLLTGLGALGFIGFRRRQRAKTAA